MPHVNVIVVTGLPASGKTTLARELAARWRLPLIAKDLIKEPLLDVLGAADAAQSRRLSDASFAVLFDVARELVAAGTSLLLEGNLRPGEHEAPLMRAIGGTRIAQVLCRVPEAERLSRLQARAGDPARHAGHRYGEQACPAVPADAFLELPSKRLVHPGADGHPVHDALDDWMNLRAPSP
jgi:predicted kinase